MKPTYRFGISICLAVFLSSLALIPLTSDRSFLLLGAILILLLGAVTTAMRRMGLHNGLVIAAQVVVLVVFLVGTGLALGGDGPWWSRISSRFGDAFTHLQTHVAPVPPNAGVTVLLLIAIGVVTILTYVLVETLERPAWGLLPLLALFLIPALGLREDISVWYLAAVGVGYLLILFAEGLSRADSWARHLSNRPEETARIWPRAAQMGLVIAIPALALSLLLGSVIPLPGQVAWNIARPKGADGPLQLTDPTLDLRRNLSRPDNQTVMNYTTDDSKGHYMRMASLTKFDANGWQMVPMQLQNSHDLPKAPGLTVPPAGVSKTSVKMESFPTEYLPAPYAPKSFAANGTWSFDPQSLMILSTGPERAKQTVNLNYEVTSDTVAPDGARLSAAAPGRPPDAEHTMALPPDLPPEILDLTTKITQRAKSPALKAAAIQKYLRSDEFTYSLEPQPGSSYQALSNFLLHDKTGYCEQFAASMALMARVVGIPSRVSVGFLPGVKKGNRWVVTSHDMHAWPELYFEGEGWVRFEPTPAVQSGAAPPWTVENSSPNPSASPAPRPTEESTATAEPTAAPTPTPSASPSAEPESNDTPAVPWRRIALAIGLMLLVVALAAVPSLLRRRLRDERLGNHDDPHDAVEAAWAEVHDTVIDLGRQWPILSPRAQARYWGNQIPASAAAAFTTLALLVERSRYAKQFEAAEPGELAELVVTIRTELLEAAARDDRLSAIWWPKSFFSGLKGRLRRS